MSNAILIYIGMMFLVFVVTFVMIFGYVRYYEWKHSHNWDGLNPVQTNHGDVWFDFTEDDVERARVALAESGMVHTDASITMREEELLFDYVIKAIERDE